MATSLQKLADGSIEIIFQINWPDISAEYQKVVEEKVKQVELPGFRKGKAPRNLVEEKLDKNQVYEEVIKSLVPKTYLQAINEQKIKPITNPKIDLLEAEENKDWKIKALTCEKPEIKLGDYKAKIKDLKAGKQAKIWLPGQEPKKEAQQPTKPSLDEIFKALYEVVEIKLPSLLVENEVNRLLSELVDQTKKLGLTVEQYLSSTNRTVDTLKQEYTEQAKRTLVIEFALGEIAEQEKIQVSDEDLNKLIEGAKTEEEKKVLSAQKYFLATLIRRQKTIDFLASL